jgi:hypothetical protein
MWFAYISTTTIGLGDFFLEPEIIFLEDVFRFSLLFLTGFVFLSMFLGEVAELLGSIFPDAGETLKERVERISPIPLFMETENAETEGASGRRKTLEILKKLVCQEESDDRDLAMVVEEEELLQELLDRKNAERLQMETEGD